MIEIKAKLKTRGAAYGLKVQGKLPLSSEQRSRRGAHARLESGEEVVLKLPAGETLRGGDHVTTSDGRVIEVVAPSEKVLHIEGAATVLARIAYRLGNRHVPVEAGEGWLRVGAQAEVRDLLKELGGKAREMECPFNPDFGEAHDHGHAKHEHSHEHHDHDHDHDHEHGHGHGHHQHHHK